MAALQSSPLKSNAECPTLPLTPLSPHCNISSHLIAALPLSAELDLFLSSSLKATVCVFHYVCQDVLAWTFPGRSLFCYFFFKPLREQVQECSLLGKAFNLRDFSQDSWVNQSVPLVLCENWPFKKWTNSGSNSKPQLEVKLQFEHTRPAQKSAPAWNWLSPTRLSSSNPSHANTNSFF